MRIFLAAAATFPATAHAQSTSTFSAPTASTEASAGASADISTAAAGEAQASVPRPWVIGDIAVSGNKNVKSSVIRAQVKAHKGDLYDRPDLDRDVQSILGLGDFERVAVDISLTKQPVPSHLRQVAGAPNSILLTFIVKEKPLIGKITFSGNKKVSRGVLNDATTLKAKDPLDAVKLNDNEQKIIEKYRDKGFLDATVESKVDLDTNTLRAQVAFLITEGPKSKIELVVIDGIKSFKPKKILKLMKNRRKKVFVEKDLRSDQKNIEAFYLNHGYLDVEIGTATVTLSEDKTNISIRFPLTEGESYKFGDTTFSGNEIYASTELAKVLEYRRGKVFNQERYEESIRAVQELYANKGRLRARVAPVKTFNDQTQLMNINYAITEGDIVYIDHIDVEGNKATKTHVLRRELVIKPGDVFSAARIRRSRDKILNLGFIDDVEPDIQPTNDPDKVDVTFDIAEGKPGLLTAGAAYSSVDGFIGTLSMSHLNLFGRAQQAKVEWQFGRRVLDYSMSWRTPWVYNRPISLGLDIFNTRRILPFQTSTTAYTQKQSGGSVHLGPRFKDDRFQLDLSYTFSRITISNIQEQFRGPLTPGTSDFSSVSVSLAHDTRDSVWDPTRGSRKVLGAQLAGGLFGGDINFFSPSITTIWYHHLFSVADYPCVMTIANRGSYVTQFGKTREVPVNNRFFLGGQDTMRGYAATGEVGFPSGGKVMDVFNIEIGFPLARERRKTIVKIVAFFDVGSAWDTWRTVTWKIGPEQRNLKTDAGLGLRFTTPAFPIRLDWGYGFNHRPGEKQYQINFGLGNLF